MLGLFIRGHCVRQALWSALVSSLLVSAHSSYAGVEEQAKRIHERLTGVIPSSSVLQDMVDELNGVEALADSHTGGVGAARVAMENDSFYRATLKNWVAPWTNRDQDVFVDLNDYIATVMGYVRDEHDFRGILYDNRLYTFSGVTPAYAYDDNDHYIAAEATDPQVFVFKDALNESVQSSLTALPAAASAGVVTSRAAAEAFFIDGTNRAMFRYNLVNHLCMDLEELQDPSLPPDRIRRDVSRSPGGDSRTFVNTCVTCHAGMDPLAQAYAYYDYDNEGIVDEEGDEVVPPTNQLVYNDVGAVDLNERGGEVTRDADSDRPSLQRVQYKYHINEATFPAGFETPDDSWTNYWRDTANDYLGWSGALPGSGNGAQSMGMELAHSEQFARCQVEKVFKAVCLRDPINTADLGQVDTLMTNFAGSSYSIKQVFAETADYCKGS